MIRKITTGRARRVAVLATLCAAVAIAAPLYAFGGSDTPVQEARATLLDPAGHAVGSVKLQQKHHVVHVKARFQVLPAGFHGFHVHAIGTCTAPAFTSAGGHLNPAGASHGAHAGDMPVLLVNADGTAEASFETDRFTIDQLFDADGSAIVVHANADNYANIPTVPYGGPVGATLTTGDAGARSACGVVETEKKRSWGRD